MKSSLILRALKLVLYWIAWPYTQGFNDIPAYHNVFTHNYELMQPSMNHLTPKVIHSPKCVWHLASLEVPQFMNV